MKLKQLLESIEKNTSEHWKNYYKDVPIECIYDDLVIDINEIKRLQNNWNELKEWLEETDKYSTDEYKSTESDLVYMYYKGARNAIGDTLTKMQEIESRK